MKKQEKSKEQIALEKKEIADLKAKISNMTTRVPKKVLEGSYQMAVNWKQIASSCLKLLDAKIDNVEKLRKAYAQLHMFEA